MSKSTIPTMEEDLEIFDMCIDMLKNPNSSSKSVTEGMCASLLIIQERIEALNSPVLELDVTKEEYEKHLKEVFIKYDVMHLKKSLFPDLEEGC